MPAPASPACRGRYRFLAHGYDALSGEPVYRVGRRLGIDGLALRGGATVLDLGCGTGLNLPALRGAVGPGGRVIAVDASPAMLAVAGARVRRAGWSNVHLLMADAQSLDVAEVLRRAPDGVDAALATYALSLMPRWSAAWARLLACCRPGARVAVVDLAVPSRAPAPLRAVARLACRLGGSDPRARPWRAVETGCTAVTSGSAWAGHVEVRVGQAPSPGHDGQAPDEGPARSGG